MRTIFRGILVMGLSLLFNLNAVLGQDENSGEPRNGAYVQLKPGIAFPNALGNNFLAEAYDLNAAASFMAEARLFF